MSEITFGVHGKFYPLSAIYETAAYAEDLGFSTYWLGDRIVGFPQPHSIEAWSALAALATKTERIRLGISVTDPYRRNPAVFAQTVVALDHISNGRFDPGIGVGEAVNTTAFGMPMERPVSRLEEFLRLANLYWTGERITFDGTFFQARDAIIQPTPVQRPHPPVWIAANSPASLRITGRVGDGWLPAAKSPEMYREDLTSIRNEAVRAGRDPDAIQPGLFTYVVVNDDPAYVQAMVEGFVRRVLAWWQSSLKRLGVEAGGKEVSLVHWDGSPKSIEQWEAAGREVPLEVVDQLVCYGPPDRVALRLRDYIAAGVQHFAIVCLDGLGDVDRWKATARYFSERVIPLATTARA